MCFSATASFAVGAGLIIPGYIAISRTSSRSMLAFSVTPVVFSFHQFAEGFIWLSLQNPGFASFYKPALYGYSLISQPVWPIWVPLIFWLMERDLQRKKLLFYFLLLGIASAAYMFFCLVNYNISAVAENGHIRYYRDFPLLNIMRPINFVTIAITPFLSTLRWTKLLASAMFGSLVFTYLFYTNYLISVWCFFAAILSLLVILVVYANRPEGDLMSRA
ncbi:DUF6629 family protein [Flavihumibacter stibioxidans]|uniref:Uncharacterized protein n=1 Tax=Flavihumibacter stibioxidans TaxID=1834163 RepID=A0ABR7MAS0_9BACT|nr:DUF6629 family protein [Flavihumibacter stibioxidans]MBC6492041.1 hypothetical protein [Flavihumibacter stibioxidans]